MVGRNAWCGLWLLALAGCGDAGAGGSATEGATGTTRGASDAGETTQGTPTTSATVGGTQGESVSEPASGSASASDGHTGGLPTGTGDATGTGGEATASGGSEETGDTDTGAAEFCGGGGGVLLPGDEETCTGDLGKQVFTFALCSCTDFTTAGVFTVDAFNSDPMKEQPLHGGSVGINGRYTTVALADIGGTLWVDGKVSTVALHEVGEKLQCGGDVSATVASHVIDDAFVEGDIGGLLPLMTIDGDLHIPANKKNLGATVLGKTIKEPVNVKTPCDCSDPIDIAKIVKGYSVANDDAAAGLESDSLANVVLPKEIELPCGVYYFTSIKHLLALKIKLTGRTVIAIDGDLVSVGLLDLELGPDAELDLFIAGSASFADLATLGDIKRPAAFRMYVGEQVTFASLFTFGGNLYQPNAVFNAAGLAGIWGSLFVGGINLIGAFAIHYDEAVLDIEGCEPPGGDCAGGDDCGNPTPACIDGACVPCTKDEDCGAPLTCQPGGVCYPLPG